MRKVTLRLMAFDLDTDPNHPKCILNLDLGGRKQKQVKDNSKFNITLDFVVHFKKYQDRSGKLCNRVDNR